MNANAYAGPIVVTVLYILLYYGTMLHIARTKFRLFAEYKERGEKFDRYFSPDREMLAADRLQLNMLEHMPPFLVLMWLNAFFVGTGFATVVGAIYLVSRAGYPVALGNRLGRNVKNSIFLVTGPGYIVMAVYCGALIWAVFT